MVAKEKRQCTTYTVQHAVLWFPGHAITLREGNQTFSLLGYVRRSIDNFRLPKQEDRNLSVSITMRCLKRDPSPISRKKTLGIVSNMCVLLLVMNGLIA